MANTPFGEQETQAEQGFPSAIKEHLSNSNFIKSHSRKIGSLSETIFFAKM